MNTQNQSHNIPAVSPFVIDKITIEKPQHVTSTQGFASVDFTVAGFKFTVNNIQIRLGMGRTPYALLPQHPINDSNGDRSWRKTVILDSRLWEPISAAILKQWRIEESQETKPPLTPLSVCDTEVPRGER